MNKRLCGAGVAIALLAASAPAEARYVWYHGARAERFIARYLPGASIPGEINQAFAHGPHKRRHGWASCYVPAMGARSEGAVSVCYVKF